MTGKELRYATRVFAGYCKRVLRGANNRSNLCRRRFGSRENGREGFDRKGLGQVGGWESAGGSSEAGRTSTRRRFNGLSSAVDGTPLPGPLRRCAGGIGQIPQCRSC